MFTKGVQALLLLFFLWAQDVSGSYPKAQNVTWKSTNFKTLLTWEPKPSEDYSYTVTFSAVGGDTQNTPHCVRSVATWCDLSGSLTDIKACYKAYVVSEPPLGATSDLIEFPETGSTRFCPYQDTEIGQPVFKLEVSPDKRTTTLYVTDPLTAMFKEGQQQNIRDIFSDQLQYRVTYRKNKSSGKKVYNSLTNVIQLKDLDRGESYCFNVQAYIPSRNVGKQLGEQSHTMCSNDSTEVYSVTVIASAVLVIVLLIGIIIISIVACCKHRKAGLKSEKEKEGMPLRDV